MADTPKKTIIGTITNDPALEVQPGHEMKFNPCSITHDFKVSALTLPDWTSFNGILISIHFSDNTTHNIDGSGVIVAPGIAVCALHVIKPKLEGIKNKKVSPVCTAITKHGLQIWRISTIAYDNNSDLAILGLTLASALPPDSIFNRAIISTRLPKIGENLLIAGFRASDYSFEINERAIKCSGNILVSNGEVTARFTTGRDKSMIPWPCLEVNCPTWGGMSGGPVFDSNGYLIGLLCSSFDNQPPSYVSLIWPILTCDFEGGWPKEFFTNSTTLLDMHETLCAIDKREAIQVSAGSIPETKNINYVHWE